MPGAWRHAQIEIAKRILQTGHVHRSHPVYLFLNQKLDSVHHNGRYQHSREAVHRFLLRVIRPGSRSARPSLCANLFYP